MSKTRDAGTSGVIIKNITWLWAKSACVYEGKGLVVKARRLRFLACALMVYDSVSPIINAPSEKSLGKLIDRRPETVGAVIWPYQCLGWNARIRLARIREHYSLIDGIGGPIDFAVEERIILLDLSEIRQGLLAVVDRPKWFMREGELAINLFLDDIRIYSLVFSLFRQGTSIAAFVGAIQGRDLEGILDDYRALTKASYGMRPRDLLIEVFRMFCDVIDVEFIFAVADEFRQHRSRYYGKNAKKKLTLDYDKIWDDRGGIRVDRMFYRLDVDLRERDLNSVSANKRSMYRRRYDMLRSLKKQMSGNWKSLSQMNQSPLENA